MTWNCLVRLVSEKKLETKKVTSSKLTISFTFTTLLLLSGCQWIGNTADSLGSHLPVMGDRCENWQCFTESGREQSDANKAAMAQQKQQDSQALDQQQPSQQPIPGSN